MTERHRGSGESGWERSVSLKVDKQLSSKVLNYQEREVLPKKIKRILDTKTSSITMVMLSSNELFATKKR